MNTFELTVKLNEGKVLMEDLVKYYDTIPAALEETVQNAIDAGANRIESTINIKASTMQTCDNGPGMSREKMQEVLTSVRDTLKSGNKRAYGEHGIGNFAPLAVAAKMTITTCPEPRVSGYSDYYFEGEKIRMQKSITITGKAVDGLTHDPNGKVWWRTRSLATGLTGDKKKSAVDLEELARSVAFHYGDEIRRRKINITLTLIDVAGKSSTVKVEAPEFSGKPLDVYRSKLPECGEVEIRLFVARLGRGGRKGTIAFGRFANPSRITEHQFVDCARKDLDGTVAKALTSGVFEGVILCEKVGNHPTRKGFVDNDALLALCEVIEKWYADCGKAILAETEEQDSDHRFQQIGASVMPYAELLIKQEEFRTIVGKFLIGNTGDGHARLPRKNIIGQDDGRAISAGGGAFGERSRTGEGEGDGSGSAKRENPEHRPGIIYGPRGKRRTEVKGSSTGLRFEYIEMEEFRVPFVFDSESGTLSFNIRHPSWGLCQPNDEFLRKYHVAVLTTALSLEMFRDESTGNRLTPELERFAHESLTHHTFAILNGDALTTSKGGKK